MRLGIRTKLSAMVLGIIAAVLVGMTVTVFFFYKDSLDDSLKAQAMTQNSLIRDEVELWFSPFFSAVTKVIGAAQYVDTPAAILPLLREINQSEADVSTIYWTGEQPYKNGGFFIDATEWVPDNDYDQTTRSWYKQAKSTDANIVTDPYIDLISGKVVISAARKIEALDGSAAGVVGLDIFITKVGELVQAQKLSKNGSSYMLTKDGLFVTHTNVDAVLKESPFDDPMLTGLKDIILGNDSSFGYFAGNKYYYSSVRMKSTDWVFITFGPLSDIYSPLWSFAALLTAVSLCVIAASIALTLIVARSMTLPLAVACAHAESIASGNLINDFDKNLVRRKDEFGDLARSLQNMIERLRSVIREIDEASLQVTSGSQQMSSTSQQISQGATEQAASVEEISAAMEEMTSNIKQNADNALQTEKIAQKSVQAVELGGNAVSATVNAMKEIASKINIIEEIARSTNMLSLNASIEAARAGEFGKGFAVVASEVGKLAERSQKEAGEISTLSRESVTIAEQAGTTIAAVIPEIKRTAELVQEISAASNEQTTGTEQINQAIMQLDKVVQQNASAAEESASMSEELAGQSEQMRGNISFFKITNSSETAPSGVAKAGVIASPGSKTQTNTIQTEKKAVVKAASLPSKQATKPVSPPSSPVRVTPALLKETANDPTVKKSVNEQSPKISPVVKTSQAGSSITKSTGKEQSKTVKKDASKAGASVLGKTKGTGINLVLDEDVSGPGRDSLDNEYQEF